MLTNYVDNALHRFALILAGNAWSWLVDLPWRSMEKRPTSLMCLSHVVPAFGILILRSRMSTQQGRGQEPS